jgi:hypothetical protein
MDLAAIQRVLATATKRIAQCENHIARQAELIDDLHRQGLDTASSKELLATFRHTLILHVAERDRLLRALDAHRT